MKDIIGLIIFVLTMPIWIITFVFYYGVWVGIELAQRLIKETFNSDE